MQVKAVEMTFNLDKRILKPTSNMYIFSVLVTDELNCWFAVKPDICNLKTHARLHDCTRLQPSDHEDFLPKTSVRTHSSRTSSHIGLTVSSVYLSHCHSHKICITRCLSPLRWYRKSCLHKRLHYLTHALLSMTERTTMLYVAIWRQTFLLMKILLLWNAATLWSDVRVLTPAGSRSGSTLSSVLLCCPAPPPPGLTLNLQVNVKARGYRAWRMMNGRSSPVCGK